ncbi:BREX system P-loop protein BrxC [Persicobacter sp. CCB-QB2]|uniref:BREX system P-loop protein BrxC n=1 Tax=Persicobacter sp. CCB-QB2 TaxID=1561025 RepID=UPI0006A9ACAE|nr:BREX system P-loop protein BrxC [Persicobacter sp. CCB-QB2]
MELKTFFAKDVGRNIETVIKADDRTHIADEVSEYVITREIAKKIGDLFQAYKQASGTNGVWISGFFGSGKSHLLKILSYVLENKEFNGTRCGEVFAEKIENDALLKGDIQAAINISSESILFNIDQQSQITSKANPNAILSVFYKVFFDHLGYYGYQQHVAEFESWLDKEGHYAAFKTHFQSQLGKSWEMARRDYHDPDVEDAIAEAVAICKGGDAERYLNILDKLEDNEKQSIENFCERVDEYIQRQGGNFRLNFFVDEVGQYIGDNTKLMLNLQTIAETLATRTKGRSWIFVTSQEDMEKVVGDMNKQQQNDFSRIQARFSVKVPLTSANIDEVIEKRLLSKNDLGQSQLTGFWHAENANMRTLLAFRDSIQLKSYQGEEDFISKYPFASYQFDLFQQCRISLSTHNAFQGKHASVGERSMLGVFQQIILQTPHERLSQLVSFDLMYEGIRNELRSEIQRPVLLAEGNIEDPLAIRVLKALFLVKYFRNFKATLENVAVLLLNDIKADFQAHQEQIEHALNLLESQSFVQRSGEVYEFLTDDEKEIENDIKNTDIEEQAVPNMMRDIFFDEVLRLKKIQYAENKQEFEFTPKINGQLFGKDRELKIELISPDHFNYENIDLLASETMSQRMLRLVLPADKTFYKDLKLYLATDKYIRQNNSANNRPERTRILQEKGQLNGERRKRLSTQASGLLTASTIFMNGGSLNTSGGNEARSFLQRAAQELITYVYPNLKMIGTQIYTEDLIRQELKSSDGDLFHQSLREEEQEVFNLINRRKQNANRTSLSDLKECFERAPYGWPANAIWLITMRLVKKSKLEVRQDSNLLESQKLAEALLNSRLHGNVLLEPQEAIDPKAIKNLKTIYQEAFDEPVNANDGKEVARDFQKKLGEMLSKMKELAQEQKKYPFLHAMEAPVQQFQRWEHKEYRFFLNEQAQFEDALLDFKEDLWEPVLKFWNGEQKSIFDKIYTLLHTDAQNLSYLEEEYLKPLNAVLEHASPYKGSVMQQAKGQYDIALKTLQDVLQNHREEAIMAVDLVMKELQAEEDFTRLSPAQQQEIIAPFTTKMQRLAIERFIANLKNSKQELEQLEEKQWNRMAEMLTPAPVADPQPAVPDTGGTAVAKPVVSPPKPAPKKYIKKDNIRVNSTLKKLENPRDVEAYLDSLRKAYLKELEQDRIIMV